MRPPETYQYVESDRRRPGGQRWRIATAAPVSSYGACYYFVSPHLHSRRQSLEERKLELRLERAIDRGVHEDFYLSNYSGERVKPPM